MDFNSRMLSMQPPFGWCLNETTRLWTFGKLNSTNFSWICFNCSPLRSSRLLPFGSVNKCLAKIFFRVQGNRKCFHIRCLVDLFLNQHFCFFHNLSALTISNKVEMHTKVNHCSWNGLEYMDNIINLTFAIIDT